MDNHWASPHSNLRQMKSKIEQEDFDRMQIHAKGYAQSLAKEVVEELECVRENEHYSLKVAGINQAIEIIKQKFGLI